MTDDKLSRLLDQAFARHNAGDLAAAGDAYRRILEQVPEHFDALHLLGVVELQRGDAAAAERLIGRAIALRPTVAAAHGNRARAREKLADWPAALADYQAASRLEPENGELHFRQGIAWRKLSDHAAALACYDRALQIDPAFARAWFNRGNALIDLQRAGEAVDSYRRAAALNPGAVEVHFNLGTALLGMACAEEAIVAFDRAIALHPEAFDAQVNKGNALRQLGRHGEAVAVYARAVALRPAAAEAYNNMAAALLDLGRTAEALSCFAQAVERAPEVALFHLGLAGGLRKSGQLAAALASFDRALELEPDNIEARTGRSLCRLLHGELPAGFAEYEWRWRSEDLAASAPAFPQPLWLGGPSLAGRRILLRWEQGLGDTIQFCRYARLLGERGAHVILVVQPPLLQLLTRLEGSGELLAEGQPLPPFDYHCPLLSLPLACGTDLANVPTAPRYIHPDAGRLAVWRQKLGRPQAPRIGLAWSGRPEHKNDANRSLALADLLTALPDGLELVVLQKDIRPADRAVLDAHPEIRLFAGELGDFADTAALCEEMDLVISVDTSIAHLAGALGRPLWLLLPYVPDWRWLMERSDSPWYPTARLFRQPVVGDWQTVLADLRRHLQDIVRQGFRQALAGNGAATSLNALGETT